MNIIESLPWALPIAGVAVLVGLVAGQPLARRLGISPALAMALVISTGVVLAATLTPLARAGEPNGPAVRGCDLSRIGLPSAEDIARSGATDIAPNILLFVPLGFAIGLVPASRRRLTLLMVAGAAPILIELTQLLAPALARGCESADVVDNLTGLAVGYAFISVVIGLRVAASGEPQQSSTDEGEPLDGNT